MNTQPRPPIHAILLFASAALCLAQALAAAPALPETMGTVNIPAQEWPVKPGPREIAVTIRYPHAGAKIQGVQPTTGLMLSLHNWGGTGSGGSADPGVLAEKYNVVAISVDYLQSGKKASIDDPEPYDFGWLQALDALRALHFVFDGLKARGIAFDSTRIFTTGGSGGGNVSLMANKLAPRTFTAVIDMCGMKKLNDDIAFNLPGGSSLDARWSRDPKSPFFLTPDAQEIRFVAHPAHLAAMKKLGCTAKIITVHGSEDAACSVADAQEYAANMKASGLDFTFVNVTKDMLDGKIFTSTGHALGNRTLIVGEVAGKFLDPKSPDALHRASATDFERKEDVGYRTANGTWIVSYAQGFPVGRFEAAAGKSAVSVPAPPVVKPAAPTGAATATVRTFYTGHSFAGAAPNWLGLLAKQAQITGYENLGRQALGGSRVIDHWRLADERNEAKKALITGKVDVLTLSPNMLMPDDGIDLFVDFALKHNPDIRILVQGSWMTWDGLGKDGIKNAERDSRPASEIRDRTTKHMDEIRTQLRATNARVGREVCTLIPVGTAVVRLRELIAEGKLPGFTKPSQLFVDDIGHNHAVISHLSVYMYFAAVFHRDPREIPGLSNIGWSKEMGTPHPDIAPLLKKIARETMQAEPMSGMK